MKHFEISVLRHTRFAELRKAINRTTFNIMNCGSMVERPLCDREVAGSIPGRVIPKTLKMVLAALSLGAQH